MKSRSALPGRPSWVGRGDPSETDRSQEWHLTKGQFDGRSDHERNAELIFTV